jgi:ABC-2 type transport system permease protein
MFNLVFKDFLTISKSKSDLLELLFMPFILIAILGFALGGLLMNDPTIETFQVGVVNEQNFEQDLNRFEDALNEQGVPEAAVAELIRSAEEIEPVHLLEELMKDEELREFMVAEEFEDAEAAKTALEQDEIAGYVTIPEGFSYAVWEAVFQQEDAAANLEVAIQTDASYSGNILQSVVSTFSDQYNLETSIALATNGQAEAAHNPINHGEVMQLSVEEPVSAFQYYTIGMGVMFALSTAPTLASRAFKEKEQHVFGRIMLSGMPPLKYLTSKLISGTLITFVQLLILFLFSTLVFGTFRGRDMDFWIDMIYTTGLYALLMGSLSSLLTSISLNANDNTTVNFFGSFVSVFAFLGGSFTPVEQFSESLKQVGNWTPNGAAMTSYLQIMQEFDFQEVWPLMARVVGMTIVAIIAAVFVFPKRRLD